MKNFFLSGKRDGHRKVTEALMALSRKDATPKTKSLTFTLDNADKRESTGYGRHRNFFPLNPVI
jgi:hypothetical protein